MKDAANPSPDARGAWLTPGLTPASLIDGVKRRDPECERRLHYLYEPLVLRRCLARVRNRDDAMDITQEVFVTAFDKIAEFTPPPAEGGRAPRPGFRPWLYAILWNKIGDHIRRRANQPAALGGSDAHEAFHQVPDEVDASSVGSGGLRPDEPSDEAILARRALELARAEFEDRTWEAARLRLAEGRSAAEVAEAMGMTTNAVNIARSRVARRIREILKEFDEDLEG